MLKSNWLVFEDIDELSEELARNILKISKKTIITNDSFKIVLSGGNSVVSLYKILNNSNSNWKKWHVYLGDERCLPVGDKDRNNRIINQLWLGNGKILKKNIHFIHAELGSKDGADHYEKILKNVGDFDVVLLSMGEDGHTSLLFPNHSYNESKSVVVENNSPKYPRNRISISYSRFNKSSNVFKIINGALKQEAVKIWLNGGDLPISKIYGQSERVFICKNALYRNI